VLFRSPVFFSCRVPAPCFRLLHFPQCVSAASPALQTLTPCTHNTTRHSDLELAYQLNLAAEAAAAAAAGGEPTATAAADWSGLVPGACVAARHEATFDYGAVVDIEGQEDLVGLVYPDHGAKDLTGGCGAVVMRQLVVVLVRSAREHAATPLSLEANQTMTPPLKTRSLPAALLLPFTCSTQQSLARR
jgi:hypothetical protein